MIGRLYDDGDEVLATLDDGREVEATIYSAIKTRSGRFRYMIEYQETTDKKVYRRRENGLAIDVVPEHRIRYQEMDLDPSFDLVFAQYI